jgi:hypothetical protein
MSRVVPSQVVGVIDQIFPFAKDQKDRKDARFPIDKTYQNEMAAIIELVDQIPSELLRLDPDDYVALLLTVTAIKNTIPEWKVRNYGLEHIHGYGHGNLNPVTIIRNALVKCPDEGVAKSTSDLPFISIQEFKDNLRIDISSANQALQNGEWKASTILTGATIEAVLLYVLKSVQNSDASKITNSVKNLVSNNTLDKSPGYNLNKWSLHPLTEVATDLGLIKKETAIQTRLARNFKNLIHPGVSVREDQVCNKATALTAMAALEHVINDLSSRSP